MTLVGGGCRLQESVCHRASYPGSRWTRFSYRVVLQDNFCHCRRRRRRRRCRFCCRYCCCCFCHHYRCNRRCHRHYPVLSLVSVTQEPKFCSSLERSGYPPEVVVSAPIPCTAPYQVHHKHAYSLHPLKIFDPWSTCAIAVPPASSGIYATRLQAAEQQQQEQQKQGMRQEKTSDRSDEVSKDDHGDGANAGGDAGKGAVERVGGPAAKAAVEQTRNVQQSRKEAVVGEALEQSTGGDHVEDIAEGEWVVDTTGRIVLR